MALLLGVIADDVTGATDIAGFLVQAGLRTVLLTGVPGDPAADAPGPEPDLPDADAVVVGLKSRSIPAADAVRLSLDALHLLQGLGAQRILFKYCSTFDSTSAGNIGPVTDALLAALGSGQTVICPALPVNGRTVHLGHLWVHGVPLHESGMRHHPVTPMTDSNLMRLMEAQASGRAGNVPVAVVERGPDAVRAALAGLRDDGVRYAVLDAVTDAHLDTIGAAVADLPLVTGGSGLGAGLARALAGVGAGGPAWRPGGGPAVILSGSCSEATNRQVDAYRGLAPSIDVDVDRVLADPAGYRGEIAARVIAAVAPGERAPVPSTSGRLAPLVSATARPGALRSVQERHGAARAGAAVEEFFGALAATLADAGVRRFIVAGGETSGAVAAALGVRGFEVGPLIAPGVPWVRSLDGRFELAFKSGNFGDADFFLRAQRLSGPRPAGPRPAGPRPAGSHPPPGEPAGRPFPPPSEGALP